MFEEILKDIDSKLIENEIDEEEYKAHISKISHVIYKTLAETEQEEINDLNRRSDDFSSRNYNRWRAGFNKLQALKEISIEAGMEFQKQCLSNDKYLTDPLFGVLMRLHATSCRITGEIICLLKGGFPDGALARWRTLFEISVNCLVLNRYGNEAAIEYIKHGQVKSAEGMIEYQNTRIPRLKWVAIHTMTMK